MCIYKLIIKSGGHPYDLSQFGELCSDLVTAIMSLHPGHRKAKEDDFSNTAQNKQNI